MTVSTCQQSTHCLTCDIHVIDAKLTAGQESFVAAITKSLPGTNQYSDSFCCFTAAIIKTDQWRVSTPHTTLKATASVSHYTLPHIPPCPPSSSTLPWEQLPSQYHTLGSTTYSSLDLSSPRSAITTRTSRFSTWTFEFIGRLGS